MRKRDERVANIEARGERWKAAVEERTERRLAEAAELQAQADEAKAGLRAAWKDWKDDVGKK